MAKIDNSGYILVDFSKVDHNQKTQIISGFYKDCYKLISNEKFVLLTNVNEVSTTPIPAIVLFKNNIYNVITFEYVYIISEGDNVVVTKNEGGITVDIIDDDIVSLNKTWSSSKINSMLPNNAGQIIYDNSISHLQSNRVQSAIDELVTIVNLIDSRLTITEGDITSIQGSLITIGNEISQLHDATNIEFTDGVSVKEAINNLDSDKQDKLIPGNNISISNDNVISSVDTIYTAGNNITITNENVINAVDTIYGAGDGISISNNVISLDASLNDLSDVDLTTTAPQAGDLLQFVSDGNGLKLVPVSEYIKVVTYTGQTNLTISGNGVLSVKAQDFNYSIPQGYTPVAIGTYYFTTTNDVLLVNINLNATGSAQFGVARNVSGDSKTTKINVTVVFAKL